MKYPSDLNCIFFNNIEYQIFFNDQDPVSFSIQMGIIRDHAEHGKICQFGDCSIHLIQKSDRSISIILTYMIKDILHVPNCNGKISDPVSLLSHGSDPSILR